MSTKQHLQELQHPPPYENYTYRTIIEVDGDPVELVSNRVPIDQCVAEMLLSAGKMLSRMNSRAKEQEI